MCDTPSSEFGDKVLKTLEPCLRGEHRYKPLTTNTKNLVTYTIRLCSECGSWKKDDDNGVVWRQEESELLKIIKETISKDMQKRALIMCVFDDMLC